MPNQYAIFEFIEKFKSSYQTIDVRAALIEEENEWHIVHIKLRIRTAPSEVVALVHDRQPSCKKINSPNFKILQFCLPFSFLDKLVNEFAQGQLILDDLKVKLTSPQDISKLSGSLQTFTNSDKRSLFDWPILRSYLSLSGSNPHYNAIYADTTILRDVEIAGYESVESAIKQLVNSDYTSSSSNLYIDLDIPARIESVEAIKTENNNVVFKIAITSSMGITDLICNIYKYRSSSDKQRLGRLNLQKAEVGDGLQNWLGDFLLQDSIDNHEYLFFDLISEKIGRLHYEEFGLNQLFRREIRNPLYAALIHFRSFEQINDLLTHPQKYHSVNLKPDKLYEVSIQWLLTCSGFRTIWLHQYEKFEPNNHLYGSIDSIAYHKSENMLLLVNCTLKTPEQKELESYKRVQRYFKDHLFNNTTVRVYSAVFSDIASLDHRKRPDSQDDVRIFYREDVDALLSLIDTGSESRFIDVVRNPLFYQL